jgi:hypothetical protein
MLEKIVAADPLPERCRYTDTITSTALTSSSYAHRKVRNTPTASVPEISAQMNGMG